MQKARLWHYIHALHEQARRSLDSNMVDIAKVALQHKNANLVQVQSLDTQIPEMQLSKLSLKRLKKLLSTKVEEFRSIIEFIRAKYSATEAQVRIKEAVGISAEMTDVGIALDRAEDKRAKMKAKFQALD